MCETCGCLDSSLVKRLPRVISGRLCTRYIFYRRRQEGRPHLDVVAEEAGCDKNEARMRTTRARAKSPLYVLPHQGRPTEEALLPAVKVLRSSRRERKTTVPYDVLYPLSPGSIRGIIVLKGGKPENKKP